MPTQLTYAITTIPFPLQASYPNAQLTLVGSNDTSEPVSLQWLNVQIPVGPNAQQLTTQSSLIGPVPAKGWQNPEKEPAPGKGFFIFAFLPGSSGPAETPATATIPPGGSIAFTLNNIQVNDTSGGPIEIDITEGSTGSPMQPITSVTKFPAGWGTVEFWASSTDIDAGQPIALNWNGPEGATYTIEYMQKSTVVNIPPAGGAPLANKGSYPGVILEETTVFTLNVSLSVNSQLYQTQLQIAVTVAPVLPTITSFTGTVETVGSELRLSLNWQADADCTLNGSALLAPTGSLALSPSADNPLMALYTLTASNEAGSASSTLVVQWGVNSLQYTSVDAVLGVALSPDGSRIYIVGDGGVTRLDRKTLRPVGLSLKMNDTPIAAVISPDGNRLYVSTAGSLVYAVDLTNDDALVQLGSVPVDPEPMTIGVTPDGSIVFTAHQKGTVTALATSQDPSQPFSTPKTISTGSDFALGLAFSVDGKRAYVGTKGPLVVIDTDKLTQVGSTPLASAPCGPRSIALNSDGSLVFVGDVDQTLEIFLPSGDYYNYYAFDDGTSCMAMAALPDSRAMAMMVVDSAYNCELMIMDVTKMQPLGSSLPNVGQIPMDIAVSKDGASLYVATASTQGLIWLTPVGFAPLA